MLGADPGNEANVGGCQEKQLAKVGRRMHDGNVVPNEAEDRVASLGNLTRAMHPRVGNAPRSAVSEVMRRAWTYSRNQTDDELHEHGMRSFIVGHLVDYALVGRPTQFHIIHTTLGYLWHMLP